MGLVPSLLLHLLHSLPKGREMLQRLIVAVSCCMQHLDPHRVKPCLQRSCTDLQQLDATTDCNDSFGPQYRPLGVVVILADLLPFVAFAP